MKRKTIGKYDPAKIETKWQKRWASSKIYKTKDPDKNDRANHSSKNSKGNSDKYYVLDMFPYPSGEGLHVGHPKGYIATDVISRMKRMQGKNVLHPMGFDAFGLPAENYALKMKMNPAIAVAKNVKRFKKQLEILGFDYDWSREVNTIDPKYYKWTQWIFLQLWKKGLAYESYEPINWCPSCKTGLANEDVENGRCERCGTPIEKKPMRQWMLRITDYADRLLSDLDLVHIPEFKTMQGTDAFRDNMPVTERNVVYCLIKHWQDDTFLCMKWKENDWRGYVVGGIEDGETIEQTALREIQEESGYKNATFKRVVGKVVAQFYQQIKKQNRRSNVTVVYLELKDGKRDDVAQHERDIQDMEWVPRDQVRNFVNREDLKYMWDLFTGDAKQEPFLDWPESIKEAQRNWIGRSEGSEINFKCQISNVKPNYVLLHGYTGSAQKNFLPWLKSELEKSGFKVQAPELPNTKSPIEKEQVEYVLNNCSVDENTIIIGHSLGGVVAMKYLMKSQKSIRGLVLIAPALDPSRRKDGYKKSYHKTFDWNYDFELVKKLVKQVYVLSDLQETFRVDYLRFLNDKLSATLIESKAEREHYTGDYEPDILKILLPEIKVFTTRPDTLFGVTYLVLAPEHNKVKEFLPFIENRREIEEYISKAKNETEIERTDIKKEKTGVQLKGIKVINPANNEEIPVWIADYVLADYGTGAVMAVPAHDWRDFEFAKKFNLEIRTVIAPREYYKSNTTRQGETAGINREMLSAAPIIESGILIDSNQFTGKDSESAKKEITSFVGGKWVTKYKLRDWVFSRQRYWGEPIPVVHCGKCGIVAVPEKELPIKLPKVKSYEPTGTGESPLAAIPKWVNVKCPKCKGPAKRETNTMPQWAGSSWYYLRYMDPKNGKEFVNTKKEKYWSPVDIYIGGAEHATRHLIYARFWHKFLNDIGAVSGIEPFKKLQNVGLIMGEDGRKMSKRFGNVVNPDDIVKNYGADTLRVYEMFMGPFDQQIAWNTNSMVGARRFIERIWKLSDRVIEGVSRSRRRRRQVSNERSECETLGRAEEGAALSEQTIDRTLHKTIKKVTEDIENLKFNTAISALMIVVNELEKEETISRDNFESLLKLLAPFIPHTAEEIWNSIGNKRSIHVSSWPTFDEDLIADEEVTVVVQVNGKVRGSFKTDVNSSEEELKKKALELPETKKWIEGKEVKKVIVVKRRLVSIVV